MCLLGCLNSEVKFKNKALKAKVEKLKKESAIDKKKQSDEEEKSYSVQHPPQLPYLTTGAILLRNFVIQGLRAEQIDNFELKLKSKQTTYGEMVYHCMCGGFPPG